MDPLFSGVFWFCRLRLRFPFHDKKKKKIWDCSLFPCPVCPAFVILRLAERIRWTGAFLLRRERHRHEHCIRAPQHRLPSFVKDETEFNLFLSRNTSDRVTDRGGFCREVACAGVTVLDRDRRNGIPGRSSGRMERGERMDAPGLGRRCQPGFGRRAESEAAQMPRWMHLHQR